MKYSERKVQNGQALLEAVPNLKPDVIVTGIEIPILNGLDAVWDRTNAGGHAKVIFLTIDSDLDFVRSRRRQVRLGSWPSIELPST